jgi:hypothetical protein
LNVTDVVPVNPEPAIVTSVPTGPLAGVKETIEGATVTVKLPALVPVPAGLVTLIGPDVASAGTVARSSPSLSTVKVVAATPLNATAVAPMNPVPVIVTTVLTGALAGSNPATVGAATT